MNSGYEKVLAASVQDRSDAFQNAANILVTAPRHIEKDFWISFALQALFAPKRRSWPEMVFKGGTSLSKAFGLIRRFSEDIDIGLSRHDLGFNGTLKSLEKLKPFERETRLAALNKAGAEFVSDTVVPHLNRYFEASWKRIGRASRKPKIRIDRTVDALTVYVDYDTVFAGSNEYITPTVRIEFSTRCALEPSNLRTLDSLIAPVLPDLDFQIPNVPAIDPRRTFWDKIMILHETLLRFKQSLPLSMAGDRVSRHYYDVYRLLAAKIGRITKTQIELAESCRKHSFLLYPNPSIDLSSAAPGCFTIRPNQGLRARLAQDYAQMRTMVFGEAPEFAEIVRSITEFEKRLNAHPLPVR